MVCKALLIGIQYKRRAFKGFEANSAELLESHRDVLRVRQLIMGPYFCHRPGAC